MWASRYHWLYSESLIAHCSCRLSFVVLLIHLFGVPLCRMSFMMWRKNMQSGKAAKAMQRQEMASANGHTVRGLRGHDHAKYRRTTVRMSRWASSGGIGLGGRRKWCVRLRRPTLLNPLPGSLRGCLVTLKSPSRVPTGCLVTTQNPLPGSLRGSIKWKFPCVHRMKSVFYLCSICSFLTLEERWNIRVASWRKESHVTLLESSGYGKSCGKILKNHEAVPTGILGHIKPDGVFVASCSIQYLWWQCVSYTVIKKKPWMAYTPWMAEKAFYGRIQYW